MGEAREKEKQLEALGNTRSFHVTWFELLALVLHIVSPVDGGRAQRTTTDPDDRRRLRSALKQMRAYDLFIQLNQQDGGEGIVREKLSKAPFMLTDVTVDAIDYVLKLMAKEINTSNSVLCGELEDRLRDAKDGRYEAPAELRLKLLPPDDVA